MNPPNSGLLPGAQPGADIGFIPDLQPGADIGFIPDSPSLPFGAASPPSWTDVGFIPDPPNDLGFIPDPPSLRYGAASPPSPPYVLGQSADAPKPGATAYPVFPAGTIEGVLERLGFTKFAAGAVQRASGSLTGTGTSLARLSDPGTLPNSYAQHVRDIQLAGSHPEWFQEPVDPITLQPRSDEAGPEERARGIHELTWDLLRSRMTAPGTALAQGAQEAANQYKALRDIAVGPELAGKAGEMAGGTLPFVAEALIPWIGPELAAVHGGLNSGGETWQQAYDFYKSQGAPEEDAERKADDAATAVGSATALIFSGLPGGQEAEQAAAKTVGQRIASTLKAGSQAGAVMTADTAQRLAQAKRTYRPDLTLGEAAKELMESYISGQILGSLMHAPGELAGKGPKEAADNTADIEAATPTSPRPPENVAPTAGESGETENAGAPVEPAGEPDVPLHQHIFDMAASMRDLQETLRAYQILSSEPSGLDQQAEAAGQLIPQALRQAEEAEAALQEPGAGARAPADGGDTASTGLLPRAMEELLRGPREQLDPGAMDAAASRLEERAQAEVDAATREALDAQADAASGEATRLESAAPQTEAPTAFGGALSPTGRDLGPQNAPGNAIQKVNGRNPINYRYAGQLYPMAKLPQHLQEKYPNGVRFKPTGSLELSPYAIAEAKIKGLTGDYNHDAGLANKAKGYSKTPEGYTWHHVEDGETMQLVPTDLHDAVKHTGGAAVIRGRALLRVLLQLMSNGVTGKPAQPALQGPRQSLARGPGNSS
jgi:hypothetical protein